MLLVFIWLLTTTLSYGQGLVWIIGNQYIDWYGKLQDNLPTPAGPSLNTPTMVHQLKSSKSSQTQPPSIFSSSSMKMPMFRKAAKPAFMTWLAIYNLLAHSKTMPTC